MPSSPCAPHPALWPLFLLVSALLLAHPPAAIAAPQTPKKAGSAIRALKRGQARIDAALAKMSRKDGDPTRIRSEGEAALRLAVNGFIDFKELARRALGSHWDGRTPEEQAHFQSTMKALVEAAYLARVSERGAYKVVYLSEEKLENNEVLVRTELRAKKGAVPIDYRLYRRENTYLVYDVVTDDLSLLESYRSQFNQLIKKKGFAGLVATLERKRAEIEASRTAASASASSKADG